MSLSQFVVAIMSVGLMISGAVVSGQNYPERPIRLVVSQPGGGSDFVGRLIAHGISGPLGQQVIVDNRTAYLPGDIVSKAPPDGYTLLIDGTSFWIGPLLQQTPYDPVRDFAPVTMMYKSPMVLVVNPSQPVHSVKELIALAKARPGELNYVSAGTGGAPHLSMELFKSMAGVNIVRVSYKGTGPGVNALVAGEIQVMIGSATSVAAQIKSGKLRALAVTSAQPSVLFPGLPTAAASGVPGYESETMGGALVPAKTPAAIINRLNQEIVRVLKSVEVKEKYSIAALESVGSTPGEFAAAIKSSIAQWSKVIKNANIRAD